MKIPDVTCSTVTFGTGRTNILKCIGKDIIDVILKMISDNLDEGLSLEFREGPIIILFDMCIMCSMNTKYVIFIK